MICLSSVSKSFDTRVAVDSVTLELPSAQTHVLLGPSGCGKSTLLRMMAGLTWPDEGSVEINGIEPTLQNQQSYARAIGYVIQEGGLFPPLTARANTVLLAQVLGPKEGWSVARVAGRFEELCRLMGFEAGILERFPQELSGGQRQRVSLMRALMLDPPVLLLDEPLGALDPIVRSGLRAELKRIFNQLQKTVVLVTHDLDEAAFFGHTITLLKDGTVEQHGAFADLAQRPIRPFVSEFLNAQKPSEFLKAFL